MIHFYDSASPENIPSGVYAAVYINGYTWPQAQIDRMARVIRVSVEREASWARVARVLDIESGAAQPEDLVPFIRERRGLGFDDAVGYVNRSNWEECIERCRAANVPCLWWVSTLDGTQDLEGAWAVQYAGGIHAPYDVSILRGADTFRAQSDTA